jgi:hypothetical protein
MPLIHTIIHAISTPHLLMKIFVLCYADHAAIEKVGDDMVTPVVIRNLVKQYDDGKVALNGEHTESACPFTCMFK